MPKNNMNNRTYTKEQKEALVTKLLSPNNMTIPELSAQCGIPPSTLYGWKSRALQKVANTNVKTPNNKAITSNNKLKVVVETYTLTEFDLAKYCRQNGFLYRRSEKVAFRP